MERRLYKHPADLFLSIQLSSESIQRDFISFMSSQNHPSNTAYTLPHVGAGLASVTKRTSPIPSPKAHEILVTIHAASLNYRDFAMISAFYPISPPDNVVLGSDMAGEVVEVGEGVNAEEFKVGDRVTANFNQVHLFGTEYGPSELFFLLLEGHVSVLSIPTFIKVSITSTTQL